MIHLMKDSLGTESFHCPQLTQVKMPGYVSSAHSFWRWLSGVCRIPGVVSYTDFA